MIASLVRRDFFSPRVLVTLLLAIALPAAVAAVPSFRPGELWPDDRGVHLNAHGGGVLWHDGTYYWYGEHKVAGGAGNRAEVGVHVYTSRDLYHWADAGIALAVSDDPAHDLARGCILERPKVLHNARTGKFVMWFHLELKGQGYRAARSGVAVADAPTGPFRFLGSFRPNAGVWPENLPADARRPLSAEEADKLQKLKLVGGPVPSFPGDLVCRRDFAGGQMARDMTLFVDDDGKAYHLYASEENGTLQISQLTDDYLRPAGRYVRVLPGEFNEAPAVLKRGGKYFLFTSGCTGWRPNAARLAVATSIWGPWRSLGNPCVGTPEQCANTFESQSTFVLPVQGRKDTFIFMADRWRPKDAIDGRYIWLPIAFENDVPVLRWHDEWCIGDEK
ncbi:glycoside hydrolase family 43 protein [Opitutus sp. ER46]|uniref:glycoside hydrolase family 43 protein n=1 Tax=Opitutus sp. ER46 TaxID=2161864 RepID=UPI000D31B14A|nr:glycoside hydrolase family 43 protein [Opitutus sp. ER46]PTX92345.1 beta-glucanase [Opitutus sp. ER46]